MNAGFIEPVPQAAMPAVPPRRAAHSRAGTQPIQAFGGDGYGAPAFAPAPVATEPAYPPAFPESDMGYSPPAPAVAAAAPAPPEPIMVNGAGEVDPEWTRVYHDFVRIKQDCGEAVDGFTFERFTATLRKNRDTLMREHGVQHVQFSAYVKQGRAALKAKPVRH
jgi:hypothetical protein